MECFMDKVRMTLEGIDGNAFHLLGAFAKKAEQQGWERQAIDAVIREATATNYDHLLKTLKAYTEPPEDDGEEADIARVG
jgi:hypothetical protein